MRVAQQVQLTFPRLVEYVGKVALQITSSFPNGSFCCNQLDQRDSLYCAVHTRACYAPLMFVRSKASSYPSDSALMKKNNLQWPLLGQMQARTWLLTLLACLLRHAAQQSLQLQILTTHPRRPCSCVSVITAKFLPPDWGSCPTRTPPSLLFSSRLPLHLLQASSLYPWTTSLKLLRSPACIAPNLERRLHE